MTRIAVILLIAEFCPKEKRHIISVFKLIQDLLAPSKVKGRNQFQLLMAKLPDTHKAKWFAGAALNTAEQSMQSVLSTALSGGLQCQKDKPVPRGEWHKNCDRAG